MESNENEKIDGKIQAGSRAWVYVAGAIVVVLGIALFLNVYGFLNRSNAQIIQSASSSVQTSSAPSAPASSSYSQSMAAMHQGGQNGVAQQVGSCGG